MIWFIKNNIIRCCYKYVPAIILTFLFTGCSEDFLNKNSLTQLSSETFWKSEDDVKTALAAVYGQLQFNRLSWMTPSLSTLSDEADRGEYEGFAQGVIEPTSADVTAVYNSLYQTLASCNDFLANIEKVTMADQDRARYVSEVKFIRALTNFRLTQYFGDAVLAMEPLTLENGKRPKSKKEEIYAAIIADLDEAIGGLPEIAYNGHAVRGTAYAMKGKVLLYMKDYPGAVNAFKGVLNKQFSLSSNLKDVFIDGTQEKSPEILFSIRFLAPNNLQDPRWGVDVWYGRGERAVPLQSFVDEFLCIDGRSISQSPLYDPKKPYVNRDPRLDVSVLYPGKPWPGHPNGFQPSAGAGTPNGLIIEKFLNKSKFPAQEYSVNPSEQDWVEIRYADVLLMYAEALNETAGPNQEVYNALNAIRSRPSTHMPAIQPGLSKDQMREAIRFERKIEMAFEGTRYFDLKRWGIIQDVVPKVKNVLGRNKVFLQQHYLWPIPEAALNNNDLLVQNPGY
ncbi:RagB/SusD family nutrient uptake outer membrane protein [Dyadobacter crusticola]|uniref:RagB/SusD family nutrient uptake outer membrane protein n=1 Tax=Dyadobacter crusticola TaxID=292407 RepID=UPI00068E3E68|nr:RagB/SusD family nutrient uptake outer membrane protein [Dyadobacter crusticola]